jgi:hypothetical protein
VTVSGVVVRLRDGFGVVISRVPVLSFWAGNEKFGTVSCGTQVKIESGKGKMEKQNSQTQKQIPSGKAGIFDRCACLRRAGSR